MSSSPTKVVLKLGYRWLVTGCVVSYLPAETTVNYFTRGKLRAPESCCLFFNFRFLIYISVASVPAGALGISE